jgi:hypothetical protein
MGLDSWNRERGEATELARGGAPTRVSKRGRDRRERGERARLTRTAMRRWRAQAAVSPVLDREGFAHLADPGDDPVWAKVFPLEESPTRWPKKVAHVLTTREWPQVR